MGLLLRGEGRMQIGSDELCGWFQEEEPAGEEGHAQLVAFKLVA